MISFFRKIRQNLLSGTKTGTYLKYALGEIILVVIGILIALQINTWNTHNIDRKKEKEYLHNLIEDITIQETLTNSQIVHEAKMRSHCEKALQILNSNEINGDSISYYLEGITRRTFVVHDPTFQELKSSGNILLIRNSELKNKLLSFYQFLEYSALVIQTGNENPIEEFRKFLLDKNVVNVNYTDSLNVAGGVDFSINNVDVPWAREIQEEEFRDRKNLFRILNKVAARARTSSVHLDLMNRLKKRVEEIRVELLKYIEEN